MDVGELIDLDPEHLDGVDEFAQVSASQALYLQREEPLSREIGPLSLPMV